MLHLRVRAVQPHDLPLLADLWHEKMSILALSDRRVTPTPESRTHWLAQAQQWLVDTSTRFLAVYEDDRPIGCILGTLMPRVPGVTLSTNTGLITLVLLDAHGYHAGAGRLLLDGLRTWFADQGVNRILVIAPHRYPAEQAFWRALGAVDWMDMLWLK